MLLGEKERGDKTNFILEHLLCARHFKYVISFDIQNTPSSIYSILGFKKLISLSEYIRTTTGSFKGPTDAARHILEMWKERQKGGRERSREEGRKRN